MATLDYIENIEVEGDPFSEPANEYYALLCLKSGMNYLYRFAKKCDEVCLSQLDPKKQIFFFGNFPEIKGIPNQLLSCAFQWYSVSACQYVRTVGTIAYIQDNHRKKPPEYVESVIPEVLTYRDKVGAHFAWYSGHNSQDNDAERLASIIPQTSFYKDSFHVGALTVSMKRSGKGSSSKKIPPWSIVKIHERLQERYWPEEVNIDKSKSE